MTSRRNRIRRLWRPHRAAISFATGLVLGAVSSAAIYAVVSGDLTGGEPRTVFRLPPATGPSTLHDISIDDIKQMLGDRGFTCTTATPRTGEDRRTSYRCALEGTPAVALQNGTSERPLYTVAVASTNGAIASITTTVHYPPPIKPRDVASRWADVATAFNYASAEPARARRWLLASYRSGAVAVVGDAYLVASTGDGYLQLDLHARGDWHPPLRQSDAVLAHRYAPLLRVSADDANPEPFVPISLETFVDASWLTTIHFDRAGHAYARDYLEPPFERELLHPPAACRTADSKCYTTLDVGGPKLGPRDRRGYAKLERKIDPQPIVYWHAVRSRGGIAIEYWFLYLFNDFSGNQHESDWEHITVFLDAKQVPLAVFYSQHTGGSARHWEAQINGFDVIAQQPVVWVARGSHANYFTSGAHPVYLCAIVCAHLLDTTTPHFDELRVDDDYTLVDLGGAPYDVGFGTGNFIANGRFRVAASPFKDPRARRGFADPLSEFDTARDAG